MNCFIMPEQYELFYNALTICSYKPTDVHTHIHALQMCAIFKSRFEGNKINKNNMAFLCLVATF